MVASDSYPNMRLTRIRTYDNSNATLIGYRERKIKVTHPFSPFHGKEYPFLDQKILYGEDRIIYRAENDVRRQIPTSWTNYYPTPPFMAVSHGRASISDDTVISLAELLSQLVADL